MSRPKLQVTLETVTPLFLGGADGSPELRPPAFRGVMRYWYRAMAGGILGDNWGKIKSREDELWGNTKRTSKIIVRIPSVSSLKTNTFPLLPHRNDRRRNPTMGISPKERFKVILSLYPQLSQVPDEVIMTLLLSTMLGGIGKRSRRGFGTLHIIQVLHQTGLEISTAMKLLLEKVPDTIWDFEKHLQEVLEMRQDIFPENSGLADANMTPAFPILTDAHTKILLCKEPFSNWEEAMIAFWRLLRSRHYRDNLVFGSALGGRQSSPLHLRIVHAENSYFLLCTVMRNRFQKRDPDWQVMNNFLEQAATRWNGVFLMGGNTRW